jgi:hypothetical protein
MVVPSYNHATKIFASFSLFGKLPVSILGKTQNGLLFGSLYGKTSFVLDRQPKIYPSLKISPSLTLTQGETIAVQVVLFKDKHTLLVRIPDTFIHIQIHYTDLYDDDKKLTGPNLPQIDFKYDTKLNCKIIQIVEKNKTSMKHPSGKVEIYGSIRPSHMKQESPVILTTGNQLERNKSYIGYVYHTENTAEKPYAIICLSRYCRGKVFLDDIKNNATLNPGDKVRFEVKCVEDEGIVFHKVELVPYKTVK